MTMLIVQVELLNDHGDELVVYAGAETVNDAVFEAERIAEVDTGDDSYVMNEWRAA